MKVTLIQTEEEKVLYEHTERRVEGGQCRGGEQQAERMVNVVKVASEIGEGGS